MAVFVKVTTNLPECFIFGSQFVFISSQINKYIGFCGDLYITKARRNLRIGALVIYKQWIKNP